MPSSRWVISLFVGATAAFFASSAPAEIGGVVRSDGTIGEFRIGVSTERRLLAGAAMRPKGEAIRSYATGKAIGHFLSFACGVGCHTAYAIGLDRRIHDFETTSPAFRTLRGSRVGASVASVEKREGKRFRNGCPGPVLRLATGHKLLELVAANGRVAEILFLGPRSLYQDGDC